MKHIYILIFLIVLFPFQAKANFIVGDKSWSFTQTFSSWNELATQYKTNGQSINNRLHYWASAAELEQMLSMVNVLDLVSFDVDGYPLLINERPSLCPDLSPVSCVWHGWLRDEDLVDPELAISAVFVGGCTPDPELTYNCSVGGGALTSGLPKIFADEGGSGGPAITGHFTYMKVSTPNILLFFISSTLGMVVLRKM